MAWSWQSAIKTSMATVCLSGSLEDKMLAIAEAGFDGFELLESDLISCPLAPRRLARWVHELELAIDLYQPFRDLDSADADQFARKLTRAQRKFDIMEELGVQTLLVCSSTLPSAVCEDTMLIEQLGAAAELAHQHGIKLAYEALAWATHVNRYGHAWNIVRQVNHPALGLCLDSFHILSRGEDPSGIAGIPGEKIFHVQLADAPLLPMGTLQWSRHHRCFPGQGDFDLTTFCTYLLESGYDGPWSLEIFNDVFRHSPAAPTARDGHRSLLYLQEQVADAYSHPLPKFFSSPPNPRPAADAFCLQLSAGTAHAPALGATMRHLGFKLVAAQGEHSQQLLTHGPLNVIIDPGTPPTCHPASMTPSHPPALACIGIRSDTPANWKSRAIAFGLPTTSVNVTTAQGSVDVVRVGLTDEASLDLHPRACTAAWAPTFELVPRAEITDHETFLTHIDHVVLPVPEDRWASVTLLLRSVFGMRAHKVEDVVDAMGLTRSRAFTVDSQHAGILRVVLNTVPGTISTPDTQPPRRVGGVGHIAFGTSDIFIAAKYLRGRGFDPMPIPVNYYDDLDTRVALDPSWLNMMRRYSVLYETDGMGGEYYHFFTPAIANGIFFEVVQRTGGYSGYCEANSAVRLSAQRTFESLSDPVTT
ncbi:TIM barrel protein [Mycobacterium sp. Dal123C01]|uniref:TIM barrel protein n=1 Tax=Mycobacterium sp. Dal123C01 TaxID=3457577 RepID=UPI00403EC2B9